VIVLRRDRDQVVAEVARGARTRLALPPGGYEARAQIGHRYLTARLTLELGATRVLRPDELVPSLQPAMTSKGTSSSTDEPISRKRTLAIAGLAAAGTTLVLAGLGTYYAVAATSRANDVTRLVAKGGNWDAEGRSLQAEGRHDEVVAQALFGVAAAAALATGTLLVLAHRAGRVRLHAGASAKLALLGCAGSF
jgi:hypothetical protein